MPCAPGTTQPPSSASCLQRAANLLERAEKADTPGGRSGLVDLAQGWRELAMAAGYLESAGKA